MVATELSWYVEQGLVRTQQHPTLPLVIYNYAERVQYEKLWDEVLLQCRGLVMHGDDVVARPFQKFFNDHELKQDEIPWHLPCEITEKMDGSLLIVFCFQGQWVFATRGSFTSEQAAKGKEIFEQYYGFVDLDPRCTYLFEVLYPGNRIVLDYKDREDVVLLAVIETESGNEVPRNQWDIHLCHVATAPPTASPRDLKKIIRDDQEGYVVRFANGFRMKVKGEKYFELHRIYSGISSRQVWEYLSQDKTPDEMLSVLPDEFAKWVIAEIDLQMKAYYHQVALLVDALCSVEKLATRKEQAIKLMTDHRQVASAAFAYLDNKPWKPILWKALYPEMRRPAGSLAGTAD